MTSRYQAESIVLNGISFVCNIIKFSLLFSILTVKKILICNLCSHSKILNYLCDIDGNDIECLICQQNFTEDLVFAEERFHVHK